MSFYRDRVYPHVVTMLGNPKPIQKIREQIVPLAAGTVLEVGVGPGVNFPYYDPAKVSKVYALEPNPGMVVRAENQRRRTELDVEFLGLPGERIPLPNGVPTPSLARSRYARFPEWRTPFARNWPRLATRRAVPVF